MRRRGLSLAEVIVASFLMVLIMFTTLAMMDFVRRSGARARAQIEPRQQVRGFLSLLANDYRGASYVFEGFSGTLLGMPITVPTAGNRGQAMLFAVPQDETPDPDYVVTLVFLRNRTQPDIKNPNVREIVYHRYDPVKSVPPGTPGAIDPTLLTGGSTRLFDAYVPPGGAAPPNSPFAFEIAANSQGMGVDVQFQMQPERGQLQSEVFHSYLTMRNNV